MNPYIELTALHNFAGIFTIEKAPVWQAVLWVSPYVKALGFMNDAPGITGRAVAAGSFYADREEYRKEASYSLLRERPLSWAADPGAPGVIYVHFEGGRPAFSFSSVRLGIVTGFSYQKTVNSPSVKTYPLLLNFPGISDAADSLNYKRMKFDSGVIEIDNSGGMIDDQITLFGNAVTLKAIDDQNKDRLIREFYIHDYETGLKTAVFNARDKRNRMSFNAPSETYALGGYPHIDPKLIGKEMQDAYGKCRNVPGACVNEKQVYNMHAPESGFNNWFHFKFARTITAIEEAWVQKSDAWTQVFPGLGIPGNNDPASPARYLDKNPSPVRIITYGPSGNLEYVTVTKENADSLPPNKGEIAVWWSQALKDNAGHLERRNGKPEKIRMTGTFVNLHNPGDIVKDIIMFHGGNLYEDQLFDLQAWEAEFSQEAPIGVVLEKKEQGFQAVEKIQNSSLLGFQLIVDGDKFSARADNPNREETFDIRYSEIENRDGLTVSFSGDYYASSASVGYNRDWQAKEYERRVDKSREAEIIDIYQMQKELQADTFLADENLAGIKGEYISETCGVVNPVIKDIVLDGMRWESIKLFSTGWIDFVFPLPRNMKKLQPFLSGRNSLGKLRVKITAWDRDLKTNKIKITAVRCEKSEVLEKYFQGRNNAAPAAAGRRGRNFTPAPSPPPASLAPGSAVKLLEYRKPDAPALKTEFATGNAVFKML